MTQKPVPLEGDDLIPRREEYDFRAVKETEWKACCYYEYARESESIIAEVHRVRAENAVRRGEEEPQAAPPSAYCGGMICRFGSTV